MKVKTTRIYIVGFMGSGKSTVARKIANLLGYELVDTDKRIEQKVQMTIPEIFETHGEAFFRQAEREMLLDISAMEQVVISTGGGLPCTEENFRIIQQTGLSIYLDAPAGLIFQRINRNKTQRPLIAGLTDEELNRFIVETLKEREPFYLQADYRVKVPVKSVETLLESMGFMNS